MSSLQFHHARLSEQLQREIGTVINLDLRDPRIPPMITVTGIKLSQDTRNATVHVSVYGDTKEKDEAIKALNGAAPFIQHQVAQKITIKHFPRFFFKLDNSLAESQHIQELLKEIKDDLE